MIKLKNINKSYNSQLVLENINLHIEKNDIFLDRLLYIKNDD